MSARVRVIAYIVSTERLGWPPPGRLSLLDLVEVQRQAVYDDAPSRPTATCHLQPGDAAAALCGYPWEALIEVPGAPDWGELHPELRCERCSKCGGYPPGDPAATYRFDLR